ncbi:MAG: tRNA 2-thiouridine(34) synthase MnmA, partial [Cyclobacteriaceae bacterium]
TYYIATGNYCRKGLIEKDKVPVYRLLSGKDANKDQSYFLCQLTQEQLSYALFPIGELTKPEVRQIAREQDLVTAEKKDSQGLCFVGKVRLPEFLQQQLSPKPGEVIEVSDDAPLFMNGTKNKSLEEITSPYRYQRESGKVVGEHNGAHYFTIGQRKGLNIGGTPKPLFIIETDTRENVIYTGQGDEHPGLYRKGLRINKEDIHWVREDLRMETGSERRYMVRIRYRQELVSATLHLRDEAMYIVFDEPQKAIARGQFAVWYEGDELIGSGVIN